MILRPRLLPHFPNPNPPCLSLTPRHKPSQYQQRQWRSSHFAPSPRRSPPPNPFRRPHNITTLTPIAHPSALHRRTFTTTPRSLAQPTETHYEILGVPPSIDLPTLKKRFYTLSRQHHPDLHPTDPTAVQRFQQISESYSILSDPSKRARYDRDVLHLHHRRSKSSSQRGTGGGLAATTYAGSRPPSGLSKRRSTGIFRGPPPSYFAQGGGGSYQAGRNPYTRGEDGEAEQQTSSNFGTAAADPAEFDSSGVYRTQTHEDRKRNARRAAAVAAAQAAAEEDGDFWARFVIISCTLLGGLMIASLFVGDSSNSNRRAGGMVRADGSRRDKG